MVAAAEKMALPGRRKAKSETAASHKANFKSLKM
jgi:hypothetical protein